MTDNMELYEVSIVNDYSFKIRLPRTENYRVMYLGKDLKYIPRVRKYVYNYVDFPLYHDNWMSESETFNNELLFSVGFAPFILSTFNNELSLESKKKLTDLLYCETEFLYDDVKNLRQDQYDDLDQLLQFKRGLFQCFTNYGKTEVIATLINWILKHTDDNVLVVAPGNAPVTEIKNRAHERFGIDSGYFDESSRLNVVNVYGALRSQYCDWKSDYWTKVKWIIADEVEYCITNTFLDFLYTAKLSNYRAYGFSATAERKFADPIRTRVPDNLFNDWMKGYDIRTDSGKRRYSSYPKEYEKVLNAIKTTLGENKLLVGIFGSTIIYKKPRDRFINLYNIKADVFNREYIDAFEHKGDALVNTTIELECQPKLVTLIQNIAYSHKLIFVPIAFYDVANIYISHYFKKFDFIVAFMYAQSSVDYFYKGQMIGNSNYDELKEVVKRGDQCPIGIILATSAAYRAVDLQGLSRVLLLFSDTASIVLQIIGRARSKKLEIFNIVNTETISYYSKQLKNRLNMLRSYYSECNLHEYELTSSNYGIN